MRLFAANAVISPLGCAVGLCTRLSCSSTPWNTAALNCSYTSGYCLWVHHFHILLSRTANGKCTSSSTATTWLWLTLKTLSSTPTGKMWKCCGWWRCCRNFSFYLFFSFWKCSRCYNVREVCMLPHLQDKSEKIRSEHWTFAFTLFMIWVSLLCSLRLWWTNGSLESSTTSEWTTRSIMRLRL